MEKFFDRSYLSQESRCASEQDHLALIKLSYCRLRGIHLIHENDVRDSRTESLGTIHPSFEDESSYMREEENERGISIVKRRRFHNHL